LYRAVNTPSRFQSGKCRVVS